MVRHCVFENFWISFKPIVTLKIAAGQASFQKKTRTEEERILKVSFAFGNFV